MTCEAMILRKMAATSPGRRGVGSLRDDETGREGGWGGGGVTGRRGVKGGGAVKVETENLAVFLENPFSADKKGRNEGDDREATAGPTSRSAVAKHVHQRGLKGS